MSGKKADHKHVYQYYLQPREQYSREWFDLLKVCTICGKVKVPSLSECLTRHSDGTRRWMLTKEDFEEVYGELPLYDKEG